MALSQCLEDSPLMYSFKQNNDSNLQELYNERHRLALEELVSGGIDNFMDFLRREQIQNFLSDEEIRRIVRVAVVPRCYSVHGDDIMFEQSITNSMDCSTVTYFPEISDVEPPLLEIGWPAFTTGSYRGVTRAVAHFQPSYGECIYSCKEAARRMIKSAKEVIAIVTDSLTDLDIFKDLQEICSTRKVPVYILLDQSCAPAFLKLCSNLNVHLDELRQMRVRTITGGTYFMRSGAKITGKVHERFMLIDGNRVATGSYRFNWTDGKLNSSNLIELSGQITESFDEEFRILYAQSLPLNSRGPPSARNSGIFDHLLIKHTAVSSPLPAKERPGEMVCLTSTPSRGAQSAGEQLPCEPGAGTEGCKSRPVSNSSTIGEDWTEQQDLQDEVLAGNTAITLPVSPAVFSCHVSTQTCCAMKDIDVQTDPERKAELNGLCYPNHMGTTPITPTAIKSQTSGIHNPLSSSSSGGNSNSPRQHINSHNADHASPARQCSMPLDHSPRDCFRKLTKERQHHYSAIRSKLEHMVTVLSQRRELADLTNMTQTGPSTHQVQKASKESVQVQSPSLPMDAVGTWPRARCLH